jgi:hypothetical protein
VSITSVQAKKSLVGHDLTVPFGVAKNLHSGFEISLSILLSSLIF